MAVFPNDGSLKQHPSSLIPQTGPDNTAFLRRQALQRTGPRGPLGEYVADLPHRVLDTKGGAGQMGERGPLTYPVIKGHDSSKDTTESLLREIRDLLLRMPQSLSLEARTKFIVAPREAISFIASAFYVAVNPNTAVAVAQQLVQPRYSGFVTGVGVAASPVGSLNNITWQVRIDNAVHPEFSNRVFSANNLETPIPWYCELTQGRTVQLVAINTGANPITCAGVLHGWVESLADYKPYGSSTTTGIA